MSLTWIYRLLLLGLLPFIAVLFYIKGQTYDPALINFNSVQSVSRALSSLFPEELSDKKLAGTIRSYTKEDLYEYINGHAEYFISAGFKGLAVASYGSSTDENPDPVMVVDIYDMGKGINAFGVLSDESGGNVTAPDNGVMKYSIPNGISFTKGRYYVKISAYAENIPLDEVAGSIANRIDSEQASFNDFAGLPDAGKTVSTRFIREAYRGLDFLNNVIERVYDVKGKKTAIFFIRDNEKRISGITGSFFEYFNSSDIVFSTKETDGVTIYTVKDPYEGDWMLISSAESLYGVFGFFDSELVDTILIKLKGSKQNNAVKTQ